MYYLYALFPVVFWEEVYARRASLAKGCGTLFAEIKSPASVVTLILHGVLYVAVIESLVSKARALLFLPSNIFTGLSVYLPRDSHRSLFPRRCMAFGVRLVICEAPRLFELGLGPMLRRHGLLHAFSC